MSSVGADPFLALSTHDKPAPPEPMTKQWGMGPQFEIGYSSVRLGSKCFSSSSTESFFFHGGSTRFFLTLCSVRLALDDIGQDSWKVYLALPNFSCLLLYTRAFILILSGHGISGNLFFVLRFSFFLLSLGFWG